MPNNRSTTSGEHQPTFSIIIPAYNEGARVGATLERVLAYATQRGWDAEVIAVNDGSRDNTAEIIRGLAVKNSILRLLENPGNRGKGYSVRNGMLHARGEVAVQRCRPFSPIEESDKLFAALGRRRRRHRLALAAPPDADPAAAALSADAGAHFQPDVADHPGSEFQGYPVRL